MFDQMKVALAEARGPQAIHAAAWKIVAREIKPHTQAGRDALREVADTCLRERTLSPERHAEIQRSLEHGDMLPTHVHRRFVGEYVLPAAYRLPAAALRDLAAPCELSAGARALQSMQANDLLQSDDPDEIREGALIALRAQVDDSQAGRETLYALATLANGQGKLSAATLDSARSAAAGDFAGLPVEMYRRIVRKVFEALATCGPQSLRAFVQRDIVDERLAGMQFSATGDDGQPVVGKCKCHGEVCSCTLSDSTPFVRVG